MNPYIKTKLRSCKISNPQDIFKFALEEDQKQKIRALDFKTKPDTIAHSNIQVIKGNNCQNVEMRAISLRIVPSSKIIPHTITIPHQIINSHMHPTVGQLATTQMYLHPSHELEAISWNN